MPSPLTSNLTDEQLKQLGLSPAPATDLTKPGPVSGPATNPAIPVMGNAPAPARPIMPSSTNSSNVFQQEEARAGNRLQELQHQRENPWGTDLGTDPTTGKELGNHPGLLGRVAHGLATAGNIAGNVLAPSAMAFVPGSTMNNMYETQRAQNALEKASIGEERQSTAKRADKVANKDTQNKIAFHFTGPGDKEMAVYEDGTVKEVGETLDKPNLQFVQNIQGPNGPQSGFVDRLDPFVTGADVAAGKYPKEALGTMKFSGTVGTVPKPEPKGQGNQILSYTGPDGLEHHDLVSKEDGTVIKKDAVQAGPAGTNTPLLNDQGQIAGTFNNKTSKFTDTSQSALPNATTSAGARLKNTENNQFNTQYMNPTNTVEQAYQKFEAALKDYGVNAKGEAVGGGVATTGAPSMVALSQHLATTFGSVKGSRLTKDLIGEHKDAIGWQDAIARYGQQMASGQQLSPSQWNDFGRLITNTRNLSWEYTVKEAVRRKQEIPTVPPDVNFQLQMQTPSGKGILIDGKRVAEAVKDGLKVQ